MESLKIITDRLIITELDESMAEVVHLNSLDEDNRRFVPDEVFETVQEALDTINFLTGCYENINLTTKRYSEQELLALIDEEGFEGFVAYVSDRFGDNGMVSVVITKRKTDTEIELDTFLLSCRVMGRFIEEQIIGFIEDLYKKSGYKRLVTYYKPTEKNAPVKDFFERLGYSVLDVDSAGNKKYILDLEKSSIDSRKKFGELMIL